MGLRREEVGEDEEVEEGEEEEKKKTVSDNEIWEWPLMLNSP